MSENYMSPSELRAVADLCESLAPLWEALTQPPGDSGIYIDTDSVVLDVYDNSGDRDRLGIITWSEGGPAFYPGDNSD